MSTSSSWSADANLVTAILRHFQWAPTQKVPGRYEAWSPDGSANEVTVPLEVIVPLDPERADYSKMLERVRRMLLAQYGPEVEQLAMVLRMRTQASLDAVRWQKATSLAAGLIGWEEGERLYMAARAQLAAAARSAKQNRRYHGNAGSYIAKSFLDRCFMGQTEVGSFVITAYAPTRSEFFLSKSAETRARERPTLATGDATGVSGRAILSTFEGALQAVRQCLDQYNIQPRVEVFLESVGMGVSYEFAKALGEISRDGDAEIEVSRPYLADVEPVSTKVAFEASEAAILDSVANAFAQDSESQQVTLVGDVTLLSRSLHDTPARVIRLDVEHGAPARKVRVRLNASQYDVAIQAHSQERRLRVSGRLEKEGQQWWLYDADGLVVTDETASELHDRPRFERVQLFDSDS